MFKFSSVGTAFACAALVLPFSTACSPDVTTECASVTVLEENIDLYGVEFSQVEILPYEGVEMTSLVHNQNTEGKSLPPRLGDGTVLLPPGSYILIGEDGDKACETQFVLE